MGDALKLGNLVVGQLRVRSGVTCAGIVHMLECALICCDSGVLVVCGGKAGSLWVKNRLRRSVFVPSPGDCFRRNLCGM